MYLDIKLSHVWIKVFFFCYLQKERSYKKWGETWITLMDPRREEKEKEKRERRWGWGSLFPASCVLRPASSILRPPSSVLHPALTWALNRSKHQESASERLQEEKAWLRFQNIFSPRSSEVAGGASSDVWAAVFLFRQAFRWCFILFVWFE